jgi:hypothetical protein
MMPFDRAKNVPFQCGRETGVFIAEKTITLFNREFMHQNGAFFQFDTVG